MRYTRALIPTLKEAPADATSVSHVLLLRAGYARRVGAGIYSYLPLGLRVLRKIESIVREELDRAGAQELLLPALLPAEYFQETGRWDAYGDVLLRLTDRKGGDYHLPAPLVLSRGITLEGPSDGQARIICDKEGPVVTFSGKGLFRASGIVFEHRGRQPADVCVVSRGTVDFSRCVFTGGVQDVATRKGGAGLGLHITRQLVEQMHGSVGFVSRPGEGATFWLELPVVARRGAMRTG